MNCTYQVITWKINGDPKLGPCPEKWLPLLPTNIPDYSFLQKCILHVNITSAYLLNVQGLVFVISISRDKSNEYKAISTILGQNFGLRSFIDLSLHLSKRSVKKFTQELKRAFQPKITKMNDIFTICSHIFANEPTTATLFRPKNTKELKYFLTFAAKESLMGIMDIIVEENIPYDHSGNDLRRLGEIITVPAAKATNKDCAWNDNKGQINFKQCDPFTAIWCQYEAKSVMTNYQCNGWFKADQGSHVNCYYVHRISYTLIHMGIKKIISVSNNSTKCPKYLSRKKAQLVTIDNIGEWSYVSNLAQTFAPIAKDRSLILGYTRCSTDPLEWRTLDGVLPSIDLPNITDKSDETCCLQLNIADKISYKPIQVQSKFYEGGSLQETICNKRVNYFICKRRGML
ncbi:hypothetical protein DINM_000315 [Dirofilaria immitis]|nr:hypothetical protein [Dirofilaria immitis]